jgi:hypothetical protein
VKTASPYDLGSQLSDIIDRSIFDYFIGNADHLSKSFQDDEGVAMLFFHNNAQSFRNLSVDERNILLISISVASFMFLPTTG